MSHTHSGPNRKIMEGNRKKRLKKRADQEQDKRIIQAQGK